MSQLVVGEAGCLLTICWTESIVVELAGGWGLVTVGKALLERGLKDQENLS